MKALQDDLMRMEILSNAEEEHKHLEIELLYVIAGEVTLKLSEKQFLLKKDGLFLVNANVVHSLSVSQDGLYCRLHFAYRAFYDFFENYHFFFWIDPSAEDDDYGRELRNALHRLLLGHVSEEKEFHFFGQKALCYEIMNLLVRDYAVSGQDAPVNLEGRDAYRMQLINNYIDTNYQEKISLQELSQQMYLSEAYLSRYIKRNFGMNFGSYVTTVRLHHALDRLLQTQDPITRIAMDCGFSSGAVFNKEFKDLYGISPSLYRKNHAGDTVSGDGLLSRAAAQAMSERIQEIPGYAARGASSVQCRISGQDLPGERYRPYWRMILNIGPARMLLDATVRMHLAHLRENCGFQYVRLWNLTDGELMLNLGTDKPLNFSRLDGIMDEIVNNGMLPLIEFGIKPEKIHKSKNEYVVQETRYDAMVLPDNYEDFVVKLLKHYLRRYGRENVSKWIFELWNDIRRDDGNQIMAYCDVFMKFRRAVKSIVPDLKVGGGGTRIHFNSMKLQNFPADVPQGYQPDFVSFMFYNVLDRSIVRRDLMELSPKELLTSMIEEAAGEEGCRRTRDLPFYVTEWNMTLSDRNYLNDSSFKGAYIIRTAIQLFGQVDSLAYFVGSDYTADYMDTDRLLFGGSGLLSKNGIPKPAAYAFSFLNRLKPYIVRREANYMVTADNDGSYAIICHNCRNLSDFYFVKKENEIGVDEMDQCFQDLDELRIDISLMDLPEGTYAIRRRSIGERNGSVLGVWKSLGYRKYLSKEEMDYLRDVSRPSLLIDTAETVQGTLELNLTLEANMFMLLTISRSDE